MRPKNKSDVNLSVYSETPHALAADNNVNLDYVRRQSQKGFKKQTGLPSNWEGKIVIEFGCGAGLRLLQYALKGAKVVGIDGSEVQLSRIKENAKELGVNGKFVCSKLEELDPKMLPRADLVICSLVIHHVHEWENALEIMGKVLKDKGYLYLTWVDWTLALSIYNLKNQITYRLGWSNKSRMEIGKVLFGWWDKKKNVRGLESDSFFADRYSAYYIPISYRKMSACLKKNGLDIVNTLPPHDMIHYIRGHEYAGTTPRFLPGVKNLEKSPYSFLITILLKIWNYSRPRNIGIRIVSARKNTA